MQNLRGTVCYQIRVITSWLFPALKKTPFISLSGVFLPSIFFLVMFQSFLQLILSELSGHAIF